MEPSQRPERPWAIDLMRRLDQARSLATGQPLRRLVRRATGSLDWPVAAGAYAVGDLNGPVAICTLTSNDLIGPAARLPGVAIAGRVYTANLGIEKIIQNICANPRIRFLLLCGRESPLFHPGQTLQALCANGVDPERRVIGAIGYLPVLGNLAPAQIERFRRQVELVDRSGEADLAALADQTRALLARDPGPLPADGNDATTLPAEANRFQPIRPGGRREPLAYDPKGFYVIGVDRSAKEIWLRHYRPDSTPAHEMRGRSAEAMLLGLLREDLVSQLSHAGYLGGELAKAEAALRLDLRYEQDQPLRQKGDSR
jgi:tetrahydromethanopterin S-methyltransferase subunit A